MDETEEDEKFNFLRTHKKLKTSLIHDINGTSRLSIKLLFTLCSISAFPIFRTDVIEAFFQANSRCKNLHLWLLQNELVFDV